MKKIILLLKNYKLVKLILGSFFSEKGYFNIIGWTRSYQLNIPCSQDGLALPWLTYPFINFINNRLDKGMSVFEFGSGNSTLYYADKVGEVFSVEHDLNWFNKVKNNLPQNAKIFYQKLIYDDQYCRYPEILNRKFDIVIVDGRDRVNCLIHSAEHLTDKGIIILDNSDRKQYNDGVKRLLNLGFKKIDFWGLASGYLFETCTSIFYKEGNCLGI